MKTYIATADNGKQYFCFYFFSSHKANSRANRDDARTAWKKAHGWQSPCIIVHTSLSDNYGEQVLKP